MSGLRGDDSVVERAPPTPGPKPGPSTDGREETSASPLAQRLRGLGTGKRGRLSGEVVTTEIRGLGDSEMDVKNFSQFYSFLFFYVYWPLRC